MRTHDGMPRARPVTAPSTVQVPCQFCNSPHVLRLDHALPASEWPIGLLVRVDHFGTRRARYAYWYICPVTGARDARPVNTQMATSLLARGLHATPWDRPVPSARPDLGPFTYDEVLDWLAQLEAFDVGTDEELEA